MLRCNGHDDSFHSGSVPDLSLEDCCSRQPSPVASRVLNPECGLLLNRIYG